MSSESGCIDVRIRKSFAAGEESAGFQLDVQFQAPAGMTVLYGPSGSGKTLTLDSIAGFLTPDAGRILLGDRLLFDGEAHVELAPRERNCGYVFQNYALFPHMTVRQNLAFAAHQIPRLERHRRIGELLERFRLAELSGRYPRELSGGQKQRASIARALIADPAALLLDEPAKGLDAQLRSDFYLLLREIRQTLRIPILLVTHDAEECFALADQVFVYLGGEILQRGTPLALLESPGSVGVARLLGDFNLFEAEVLALDPGRQTSRVRMWGREWAGPYLRGCFLGDRITLCARPEELRVVDKPGDNRIRANLVRSIERPQFVRADFGHGLIVDVPRGDWARKPDPLWIEIPPSCLRLLNKH